MTTTRYERDALIGQGGMANVWQGRRVLADGSRQDVAIKVVQDHLRHDHEIKDRFRQEAALTMGFHHKNVIKTYDLDRHDGEEIMVMEHVDGPSLCALTQLTTIPIPVLRYLFVSTAEGLEHIHEHGVIHRDVSPGNILLSCAGDVRVVDLGLAKVMGTPKSDAYFKGTAAYASLEALCCAELTESSDLYSLAAVFYEILTGEPPYGDGQYPQLLHRHRVQTIEPLPSDCPEDFRTILMTLLKPPGSREIGSVRELWPRWEEFDDPLASRHQVGEFIRRVMDGDGEAQADESGASVPAALAEGAAGAGERGASGDEKRQDGPHKTVKVAVIDALLDAERQASQVRPPSPILEPDAPASADVCCPPDRVADERGSKHKQALTDSGSSGEGRLTRSKRGWQLVAILAVFVALAISQRLQDQSAPSEPEAITPAPQVAAGQPIVESAVSESVPSKPEAIMPAPEVVASQPAIESAVSESVPASSEELQAPVSSEPGHADSDASEPDEAGDRACCETRGNRVSEKVRRPRRPPPAGSGIPEREVRARFSVDDEAGI